MAEQLLPFRVVVRDTDAALTPIPGGSVLWVRSGTMTPAEVFGDAACLVPLANPTPADGTGAVVQAWTNVSYAIDAHLRDATGAQVDFIESVAKVGTTSNVASGISFVPVDGCPENNIQAAIAYVAAGLLAERTSVRPQEFGGTGASDIGGLRSALGFGKLASSAPPPAPSTARPAGPPTAAR